MLHSDCDCRAFFGSCSAGMVKDLDAGSARNSAQDDASRQARVAALYLAMRIAITLTRLYGQPDLEQCQFILAVMTLLKIRQSVQTRECDCYAHSQVQSCYSCLP